MNDSRQTLPARYRELVHAIAGRGECFSKQHGLWVRLLVGEGRFLQLDTWSSALTLKSGSGAYNSVTGFEGVTIEYLGLDFGGAEIHVSPEKIEAYLALVSRLPVRG